MASAEEARRSVMFATLALLLVVSYNFIGVLDIISTMLAISKGVGEEANPILRAMMAAFGPGWIIGKAAAHGLVSFMILWFPHPIVLSFFALAVTGNAAVVANNFAIAFGVQ
ncbi:MAG: DUF5658 family protein [Pseudomonadota bacterium]